MEEEMSDWTAGYVSEVEYTYGYYAELNPLRVHLPLLAHGFAVPEIKTACELGFGQGLSANIHAATSDVEWYGTDFNPSQTAFANLFTDTSKAKLFDQSFEEFCNRADLPDFDFIALHGIWTWISDQNRKLVVDFARRKLKVGGLLYISYNTLPGWSTGAPMRHLLSEARSHVAAPNVITKQIESTLAFVDRLFETKPLWLAANPQVADRFTKMIKPQDRRYLAHEYFNANWEPMYFSRVQSWLNEAKLSFGVSANYADNVDVLNLRPEQSKLLAELADPNFRQTIRDYITGQQFRKDIWIKGPLRPSALEIANIIRSQNWIMTSLREDVSLKIKGNLGEATLQDSVYNPVMDLLSDHKVHTLGALEAGLSKFNISLAQIAQSMMVLCSQGHVSPANNEEVIKKATKRSQLLNQQICNHSKGSRELAFLASPVLGGGFVVNRIEQLFLLALSEGNKELSQMAASTWNFLKLSGERVIKDGAPLYTDDENLSELQIQAGAFIEKRLTRMKALRIVN